MNNQDPKNAGIRSCLVDRSPDGSIAKVTLQLEPHITITVTGGESPTVSLTATHHGVVLDAAGLNSQLEQVINQLRTKYPTQRID